MNIKNVYGNELIVIQFPNKVLGYDNYNNFYENINFLKIPDESYLYRGFNLNNHHFTTKYHVEYVIPFILNKCGIQFDINDFETVKFIHTQGDREFDLSYIKPKIKQEYIVHDYLKDTEREYTFDELCESDYGSENQRTDFHALYRFFHQCSHIHNGKSKTNKTIFISGDSQMIPSILTLSYYFRDLYYFDNRTGLFTNGITKEILKNTKINVDYILISLHEAPNSTYIDLNFR